MQMQCVCVCWAYPLLACPSFTGDPDGYFSSVCITLITICQLKKILSIPLINISNIYMYMCMQMYSSLCLFLKQNKRVLPSFQRLLLTEGQSSRTHPALLWLLRTRESLRLKKTTRRQKKEKQQTLSIQTGWPMTEETKSSLYLPSICIFSFSLRSSCGYPGVRGAATQTLTRQEFFIVSSDNCTPCRDVRRDFCLSSFRLHTLLLAGAFGCQCSQLFTSGGSESVLNQYIG